MEKKFNSYVLSVFTIILLFFILLPLLMCLGKITERENALKARSLTESENSSEIKVDAMRGETVLAETADMGWEYVDRLVFLGESTTYGLWRYGVLHDGKNTTQVWTGASSPDGKVTCAGTLSLSPTIAQTKLYFPDDGSALTVSQALSRKKPQYLIITLGLNNGASYYTEDQFKQCYRILLNSAIDASEDTKIILQSLFPVAKTCKVSAYTPQRIELCNTWIQDLASEYGLKYLDTASVLTDEDGYLLEKYDNGGDGIHLNEIGLTAVLQYIRTHGYPAEEDA